MEWASALGIMTPKRCQAPTTPSWGEMGGAALVPHDFVKDLRHGKATGASSPLAPLGNIPVLERKRRA